MFTSLLSREEQNKNFICFSYFEVIKSLVPKGLNKRTASNSDYW